MIPKRVVTIPIISVLLVTMLAVLVPQASAVVVYPDDLTTQSADYDTNYLTCMVTWPGMPAGAIDTAKAWIRGNATQHANDLAKTQIDVSDFRWAQIDYLNNTMGLPLAQATQMIDDKEKTCGWGYFRVDPTPKNLTDTSVCTSFDVDVVAENVTNYYGGDFWLHFDSSIINCTAVDLWPTGTCNPTGSKISQSVTIQASVVKVSTAFVYAEGATEVNGSCIVARLTMHVKQVPAAGTAPPPYNILTSPLAFNLTFTTAIYLDKAVLPPTVAYEMASPSDGEVNIRATNAVPGAPTANFNFSPAIPRECDTVTLTDTSDPGPSGATITSWDWTITGQADGIGPTTTQDTYFHCAGEGTVTVTLNVTNDFDMWDTETKVIDQLAVGGCFLDIFTSENRFCGETTPYVGKGLHEPCDAISPDVNITLYANITWNGAPVNHVLVAFEILWEYFIQWDDPVLQDQWVNMANQCVLYRTAETDKDGIARIWFRWPTPCDDPMWGKFIAIATAKIQEVKQEDTMRFDVGPLIILTEVYTELDAYPRCCSFVTITIKGKNIAWVDKDVTFVAVLYDDCDVPIGQDIITTTIAGASGYCSPNHFVIVVTDSIHVPQYAYVGVGKLYVSAFTRLPQLCGVAYCAEKSDTFQITYIGPCA